MMEIKPFLDEDFLLKNDVARSLYHDYAADQPIIDYHNHLNPEVIAQNKVFDNITEVWLDGDHYKWRAMRTLGVDEQYITGSASPKEKFEKWAEIVPYTLRNPLFHWTHLELQRYFGVKELLSSITADDVYSHTSRLIKTREYSAQSLLKKMHVEVICTTDDPSSDLRYHHQMSRTSSDLHMSMTFRPDNALSIEKDSFGDYLLQLGKSANMEVTSYRSLLTVLEKRMEFFHESGCRLSDHGLPYLFAQDYEQTEVEGILAKRLLGLKVTTDEASTYKSALLHWLCERYAEKGWVQQFHLGPIRNNNEKMYRAIGPDTGFDSIGDYSQARSMVKFFNQLNDHDQLAKTIIYNLNPKDTEVFITMAGNFQEGGLKGKIQYGAAWWYLDQKEGIEAQLNKLSSFGVLSSFVGMLTDSRSLLSFPRHEYFRRILCNLIGKDVHAGELPHDVDWLGHVVNDLCYRNAKNYFDFDYPSEAVLKS